MIANKKKGGGSEAKETEEKDPALEVPGICLV